MNERAPVVFFVFLGIIGVVIVTLFALTVFDAKGYRKDSEKYQTAKYIDPQLRGDFYDRDGRPFTQSVDVTWVYFNKRYPVFRRYDVPKNQCPLTPRCAVDLLAKTIDKDPDELYKSIYEDKHKGDFICVAKNIDIKYLNAVNRLNYRGITAEKRAMRYYPEGTLASRVIGSTKIDGDPLEGLENSLKKETTGSPGSYKAQKDNRGRAIPDTEFEEVKRIDGKNVFLTLNINIQYYAEKALNDMAIKYKPATAMAIVMDPKTSEILAMANYPKYDPNNHTNYKDGMSKNFAVQNMYEPGSTLKSFTVSAGLDKGYDTDYPFGYCTERLYFSKNSSIKCDHGPHGVCTPKNIITKSCNIGAYFVTKKIGKDVLYNYLQSFGILGRPGREFGYESFGYIRNKPDKWYPIDTANHSFGQGVLTSALSMANGYCVIANGGIYHTPKIIYKIKRYDGTVTRELAKDPGRRVIKEETAKKMQDLLANCVNEGTGKPAKIDGIQTAGKTGSAQIFYNGTYKSNAYLASFIGFAPAKNPDLVVAVLVERPQGSSYGSTVAAPVWKEIMEKSLRYRRVPFNN